MDSPTYHPINWSRLCPLTQEAPRLDHQTDHARRADAFREGRFKAGADPRPASRLCGQVIPLDTSNLDEAAVAAIQGLMDACGLQVADSATNEKGHTVI